MSLSIHVSLFLKEFFFFIPIICLKKVKNFIIKRKKIVTCYVKIAAIFRKMNFWFFVFFRFMFRILNNSYILFTAKKNREYSWIENFWMKFFVVFLDITRIFSRFDVCWMLSTEFEFFFLSFFIHSFKNFFPKEFIQLVKLVCVCISSHCINIFLEWKNLQNILFLLLPRKIWFSNLASRCCCCCHQYFWFLNKKKK